MWIKTSSRLKWKGVSYGCFKKAGALSMLANTQQRRTTYYRYDTANVGEHSSRTPDTTSLAAATNMQRPSLWLGGCRWGSCPRSPARDVRPSAASEAGRGAR